MKEQTLKVFVSSRMSELAAERQVIKASLAQLLVNAWVFENDAGARPDTIQQTYLSELDTSDLYIGIFWKGHGEYTNEEFEYARQLGIPMLVYEKRTDLNSPIPRDPRLQAFLDEISDVTSGLTIRWFSTPEELGNCILEDVSRWQTSVIREKQAVRAPEVRLQKPPHINFVGRKLELDSYQEELEQDHFVVITGGPGIGKTYLGAQLARQVAAREADIFWFNFDPVHKTEADILFWHLAEFFKQHGDQSLASYLLGELKSKKPLPKSEKLDLLLKRLERGNYIICLDDFHQVGDVADIADLFNLLNSKFEGRRGELPARFIIMARSVPLVMQPVRFPPLDKFNEQETEAFVRSRGRNFSPELVRRLWQSSQGHPKFLDLSLSAIAGKEDNELAVNEFIDNMATQRDIQQYILNEIDKQLSSPDERLVLAGITIFLSNVDIPTLEEVLADQNIPNVARCVDSLLDKNIISETPDGRLEIQSIVSENLYQRELNREQRDHLHENAAIHFLKKTDYLAAAHHFDKCRSTARSVEVLTKHANEIINTGRAGALLERLSFFRRSNVNSQQWAAIKQATGAAHEIKGEYKAALQDYDTAMNEATTDDVKAEILLNIGKTYAIGLGNQDQARDYLTRSLELSEATNDKVNIADAHTALGWAWYSLRDFKQARDHFVKGQEMAKSSRIMKLVASTDLGLGLIDLEEKHYDQAQERFERSQAIFRDLEMPLGEARALGNLSILADKKGDYEQGFTYLYQVMEVFKSIPNIAYLRITYLDLGFNRCDAGKYDQAIDFFQKAADLSKDTGYSLGLCQASSGLANANLKLEKLDLALEYAEQAYQLARQIKDQAELGISALALGDVWLAKEEPTKARGFYEESFPLLEEAKYDDELELARNGLEQALSKCRVQS